MKNVVVHIYDVTNSGSEKANNTILNINRFFKDAIGLGGIFHSAIQVHGDEEWSFGYCEAGSGVFSCPPQKNPMYTYRESIVIGETSCTPFVVNLILKELSREWPGSSYDLLSRNCNHFCDTLCESLGAPKLPAWINRFANAGDAAVEVAETTALKLKQAKSEIVNASKLAYKFISGADLHNPDHPENRSGSPHARGGADGSWFSNFFNNIGARPSSSTAALSEGTDDDLSEESQESEEEQQIVKKTNETVIQAKKQFRRM